MESRVKLTLWASMDVTLAWMKSWQWTDSGMSVAGARPGQAFGLNRFVYGMTKPASQLLDRS